MCRQGPQGRPSQQGWQNYPAVYSNYYNNLIFHNNPLQPSRFRRNTDKTYPATYRIGKKKINTLYQYKTIDVPLTNRDRKVVNCTRSRVKIKSTLTNLMKISRIEGCNGKYGSNPQGIREISESL